MPKCIYRIPGKEKSSIFQDPRGETISPPALPKCRVLSEKGIRDNECHNEDCNEATCRISPLNPSSIE